MKYIKIMFFIVFLLYIKLQLACLSNNPNPKNKFNLHNNIQ